MNPKLALFASLLFALAMTPAQAGKARLPAKPRAIVTFAMLLGTDPLVCRKTWSRCVAEVRVGPGYVDEGGTPHADGCHAVFPYSGFDVAKGGHPWLVWKIVKDTRPDPHQYRFRTANPVPLDPTNDPLRDLDLPGFDGDVKTYKWKDLNLRLRDDPSSSSPERRPLAFDFFVVRDDGEKCVSRDPTIVNRGN